MLKTSEPQISISYVESLIDASRAWGVDSRELMTRALGVSSAASPHALRRLPYSAFLPLWDKVYSRLSESTFLIQFGRNTNAAMWQALDYVAKSSPDFGAALSMHVKYCGGFSDLVSISLEQCDQVVRIVRLAPYSQFHRPAFAVSGFI